MAFSVSGTHHIPVLCVCCEVQRTKKHGVSDWLTLSAGQTVISFQPVAEKSEGPLRGRAWQVNHLHAALQREVVTQVLQMLQLSSCTCLRRNLFKKSWYSEGEGEATTGCYLKMLILLLILLLDWNYDSAFVKMSEVQLKWLFCRSVTLK